MSNVSPRWFHAAAAIKSTIYFTGGTTQSGSGKQYILDDTLALDLTQPWTIDNPPLTKLSPMTVPLSGHSMNPVQGTTQLLVAGGESSAPQSSPILIYQTAVGGSWSAPTFTKNDTASFRRLYHASIATGKDGAILQGGYQTTVANGTVVSSLVTLKASNNFMPLSTSPVAQASSAPALARHTMTLTTDGQAVILGGINSQGVVANLSVAYVLDTQANSGAWNPVSLSGTPPDPRMSFSTVLVNATTMLVFGGTADFKTAFTTPFYLDLPTWTWSSPEAQGDAPHRWGHTATMAGTSMVVAFGTSPQAASDPSNIAILDTTSNTWTQRFRPVGMMRPDSQDTNNGLSIGAVLGIAFVVTLLIVGGAFYLLVRRRKHRTRNTMAREYMGDQTARSAIKRQASESSGFFGKAGSFFGMGAKAPASSKRYSDMPMYSNPMAITSRMTQMGYSPLSLGYPETVVQHGCGQVSVSGYIYPKQACVETEKEPQDGQETAIVYHMLTQAQQEALKLSKQPATNKDKNKSKLYQLDS
ncbi:hypothetical protein BC939DRAFT_502802 [Gamsiella multidivaricata]|uniref:uncharacterized protein n=1 Tax=Gamsiella multidivaricata TaxID=101098 RepID=UPI00221F18FE|nr:uncharacterized protein BC939DRAFT_502802 [Gamsiella multidivaricata]KAG0365656.1 hypothetical protein BGZ54_006342 [Gamsiella multidivaricata]KAI7824379.1 hypothetical protein BC939DRAFT_502802 [Gamsiella multidivaricata]